MTFKELRNINMKIVFILFVLLGLSHHAQSMDYWGGCFDTQLPCQGSHCLPLKAKCNRKIECVDNSDEHLCAPDITCLHGYTICKLDNGQMSIVPPAVGCDNMALGCGPRPMIPHAEVTLNSEDSSVGALAEVTCHEGFQSCTKQLRCLPSYTWETAVCSPIPIEKFECYECKNMKDNEECNQNKVTCNKNQRSCLTVVEFTGAVCKILKKGCINPNKVEKEIDCKTVGHTTKCKFTCDETECNKIITSHSHEDDEGEEPEPEPEPEGGPEPEGEGEVTPIQSCKTEHGPCTETLYEIGDMFALRSSACHQYCKCVRNGKGRYVWQTIDCETEKFFHDQLQRCNKKGTCEGSTLIANCNEEHGRCNKRNVETLVALRSSDCVKYCLCAQNADGKYRWVKHICPKGSLFDDNLRVPACNDKKRHVQCHDVHESACAKAAHVIGTEQRFAADQKFTLPNTDCIKYCVSKVDSVRSTGEPLYVWKEKECPTGKTFDESKGRCRRRATCDI